MRICIFFVLRIVLYKIRNEQNQMTQKFMRIQSMAENEHLKEPKYVKRINKKRRLKWCSINTKRL